MNFGTRAILCVESGCFLVNGGVGGGQVSSLLDLAPNQKFKNNCVYMYVYACVLFVYICLGDCVGIFCICVYAFICVHICLHRYVCMYMCMPTCMCLGVYPSTCVWRYVLHMFVYMCACRRVCLYVYAHKFVYLCIYTCVDAYVVRI